MRRKLIAGNWKMNETKAEGMALAGALAEKYKALDKTAFEMLVVPPFTILDAVVQTVKGSGLWVGAQDCSCFEKGAHTGDISPLMIRDLGAGGVIVGHSERRADHGETSADVNAKAQAALQADLCVLICVGETLQDRESGKTLDVVGAQVRESVPLNAVAPQVIIAYEPVWAIGTGKVPTLDEVQEVHAFIRSELEKLLGAETAQNMQILYGGSVKPSNAADILSLPDVDGALVGGASLKVDDFWAIAQTQIK